MKGKTWTKLQLSIVALSSVLMGTSGFLTITQQSLFGLEAPTISILSIFFSSLLLWLFVATDWPSVLCYVMLGIGMLPGVNYGQIFNLSFGNTTFVFLLFTFLMTYALEQTPALRRFVARALGSSFAGKSPWHFIGAFYASVLAISLFISPTILFMIVFPIYEEIMAVLGLKKGDRQASVLLVALFATVAIGTAMTPINHVFSVTAMALYKNATGIAISNAQYMMIGIPAGLVLFIAMWAALRTIWRVDLSNVEMKPLESLEALPAKSKRETATVFIFMGVVLLWVLPELVGGFLPDIAAFLKTAGMAFPPMIGVIVMAILSFDGKPLLSIQEGLQKGVYWPSMFLVGATLSMGTLVTKPELGVIGLLESSLVPVFATLAPILVVIIFVLWAGLQTNVSSNLVTVSVVTTVLTTVYATGSVDVQAGTIACLIGFMASLAFMTPPSMPYVAISVGSGWTNAKDAFVYGGGLFLLSAASAIIVGYPLGVFFGI